MIKNPVITSKGKVYDRDSLLTYLHKSQGKDEAGLPLSSNDFVAFTEFKEQLKVFKFYLTNQQPQETKEPELSSSPFSIFKTIYSALFGGDRHSDDNSNDNSPTPRM